MVGSVYVMARLEFMNSLSLLLSIKSQSIHEPLYGVVVLHWVYDAFTQWQALFSLSPSKAALF